MPDLIYDDSLPTVTTDYTSEDLHGLMSELHGLLGRIAVCGALMHASPEQRERYRLSMEELLAMDVHGPVPADFPLTTTYRELEQLARTAAEQAIASATAVICPESGPQD